MVCWGPLWVYFIGEYPALPSAVFWGVLLMFETLDLGLFWLQHASTRQGWYPASERTARLSYPSGPLKEPELGSWYSGSGYPRPLRRSPSPPCHRWRMHPSAPSRGHYRPRTHAPAIGTHSGTHEASPGSVVGPPDPNSGLPSTPCGMCSTTGAPHCAGIPVCTVLVR